MQQEFTRNWGPEQKLYSPTLVVPYQSAPDRPRHYVKIAPRRLDLTANLTPQERKRGLFHATVYDAKVDMQGAFVVPTEARLREVVLDKDGRFLWDESFIAFGTTTSLTGLRSERQHHDRRHRDAMAALSSKRCATSGLARARRWSWRTRRWRPLRAA